MSEYIIHNIDIVVTRKIDFDGFEEPDKPTDVCPNYYIGKLIGPKGTDLKLFRTRQGGKEEYVPNVVLRNEGGIALIRVHNKELYEIFDLPDSTSEEVKECVGVPKESYPYSYVVVDYRDDRCQIAIEKSSVWDSKTTTIRNFLEKYFQSDIFTLRGFEITVKEKSIPTQFEKFIDEQTIDNGDVIESFTFKYVDVSKHPTARIPQELTEQMEYYSKILQFYGSTEGQNTVNVGNGCEDKLKQLSMVVTMCCDNVFDLSVKLRDYGEYTCNESIVAKFEMNEIVIANFKDFKDADEQTSDFVLSMWLDEVSDDIARRIKYGKEIPTKPKG